MFKKRTPNQAQRDALGAMIRGARKSRRLTQEELAEAMGCSPHWINRIEHGKSGPNWVDAFHLAVLLELDPAKILEEAGVDVRVSAD